MTTLEDNFISALNEVELFLKIFNIRLTTKELDSNQMIILKNIDDSNAGILFISDELIKVESTIAQGTLLIDYEYDKNYANKFFRKFCNPMKSSVEFSIDDKNGYAITGTFTIHNSDVNPERVKASCELQSTKDGETIIIKMNNDDEIISYQYDKEYASELLSINQKDGIIYRVSNQSTNGETDNYITKVRINHHRNYAAVITAYTIVAKDGITVYNQEKNFSYSGHNLILHELGALASIDQDIFYRIDNIVSILGDNYSLNMASMCLNYLNDDEYYKLFRKHKKNNFVNGIETINKTQSTKIKKYTLSKKRLDA